MDITDWFHASREGLGTGVAWSVTGLLLLAGLAGCVIPALPGHLLLFLAACAHRWMRGAEGSGLEWWSFVILAVIMLLSQILEWAGGAAGTRWFGGSRRGALGALAGGLVGMFYMPLGLLIGPLAGAFAAEWWLEGRQARPALVSGVGSMVGTLAGLLIKIAAGLLMVLRYYADVFWIGH